MNWSEEFTSEKVSPSFLSLPPSLPPLSPSLPPSLPLALSRSRSRSLSFSPSLRRSVATGVSCSAEAGCGCSEARVVCRTDAGTDMELSIWQCGGTE
eukprot:3941403-Rhodomonas_salina.6